MKTTLYQWKKLYCPLQVIALKLLVYIYELCSVAKFKIIFNYGFNEDYLIIWKLLNKFGGEQKGCGFITK